MSANPTITISEALEVLDRAGLLKTCTIATEVDRRALAADPDYAKQLMANVRKDMAISVGLKLLDRGLLRIEENNRIDDYRIVVRMTLSMFVPGKVPE